jgi:hypothetical protein
MEGCQVMYPRHVWPVLGPQQSACPLHRHRMPRRRQLLLSKPPRSLPNGPMMSLWTPGEDSQALPATIVSREPCMHGVKHTACRLQADSCGCGGLLGAAG